MAIATVERDPARDTGASDLRFRLLQEICRTPEASFWRALDRRSGKNVVVRVIEADREESSRRLSDLHRERTLAERIGQSGVMRCDVPLIEADRIFQLVDPEPARIVDGETEGGRLAVLNLLVAAAVVLADAHAHGVFHGAFSRTSCLRAADGRLLVQGFMGDAPSAAAVRDGVASDHRAFLEFANEMLQHTGGPPPRLRRYFMQQLAANPPKTSARPLADLCADLRESLEDTFPWPLAGNVAEASPAIDPIATMPAVKPDTATPARARGLVGPVTAAAQAASRSRSKSNSKESRKAAAAEPATPVAVERVAPARVTALPVTASAAAPGRVVVAAPTRAAAATPSVPRPTTTVQVLHPTHVPDRAPPPAADAESDDDAPRGRRALRPWLAALAALVAIGVLLYFGVKSRAPVAPAAAPAPQPLPALATPEWATEAAAPVPALRAPAVEPPTAGADAPMAGSSGPGAPSRDTPSPVALVVSTAPAKSRTRPAPSPVTSSAPRTTSVAVNRSTAARPAVVTPAMAVGSSATPPTEASPQAVRSRVANLVAGGNRALNALEPAAAAEAFAAALALSPDDGAAQEGSQRARRLEGVAALVRDAREASVRGDYARAVQGYSQALSNDPRNRGLSESLAAARRNVGRDAIGALLAEGHAALGAGRLVDARAAFERALAADPLAPGARRAAEQAATAILLRDEAESRRATSTALADQG